MRPIPGKPQCDGKNIYSKHEAEHTKAIVGQARGKDVRVYQCDKCYGYHITKQKKPWRQISK